MQTLTQIRQMLEDAGLAPNRQLGQCFLIDQNLMGKVLAAADVAADRTVLEVGPGTGALTEELLDRAARVVAVELDAGLFKLLTARLGGRANLTLIHADALASKHALNAQMLAALGGPADLAANLPYNVATPLVIECLLESWRAMHEGRPGGFGRLTFTVQREVADRFVAPAGGESYGPVSIVTALLGAVRLAGDLPATAFWPAPKVASRIVRIDFDPARAGAVADVAVLTAAVGMAFAARRKQIGSIRRRKDSGFAPEVLEAALDAAGIEHARRAEDVPPEQFRRFANFLAGAKR
ncbi:MAG: 16S rRNA (adenine(1518)-N(6)/adenine(1519)-N(6))-dimethyltransferase RsmA [Planctomycetota bacterium]|nr:16S rRNA (adenine(1518)-N(6)/adenine(1519)-N(6))-dimethyltransferase RsmA [Planctomycetota bacterium]